jgi:hypothetical protein
MCGVIIINVEAIVSWLIVAADYEILNVLEGANYAEINYHVTVIFLFSFNIFSCASNNLIFFPSQS